MDKNGLLINLIELVKKHPCLYDPKNGAFRDRLKKNEIWQEIAEKLKISSSDSKMYWDRLRRKYIIRRSKDLPADSNFDKMMSFLEGCCGLEQNPTRSAAKPQLQSPESSSSTSNQVPPTPSSSGRPSLSSTSENISSSTAPVDTRPTHWLGLFFDEIFLKVKDLPMNKQLDLAKQVGEILENMDCTPNTIEQTGEECCSYIA